MTDTWRFVVFHDFPIICDLQVSLQLSIIGKNRVEVGQTSRAILPEVACLAVLECSFVLVDTHALVFLAQNQLQHRQVVFYLGLLVEDGS